MKKKLLIVTAIAAVAFAGFKLLGSGSSTSATNTNDANQAVAPTGQKLYVYNWTEYITSDLLRKFTQETGIEVVYTTYESNEEMYAKLKLNQTSDQPYDIVIPSSHYVSRLIQEGLVQPLDKSKLAVDNILPDLLDRPFDPKNVYSVPYTYGFTTIAVNTSYEPNKDLKSWKDLWKPQYKDLVLLRDQRDVFSMALKSLGLDQNTTNEEDIKKAYEVLRELVKKVKLYNSDAPEVPLVNHDAVTGMIWSGSAFRGSLDDSNINVVWPEEGAIEFIDSFMIPKNAKNVEEAHKFINFLLQPENAVEVLKALGFQPANNKIKELLPEEWQNSNILFPPKEVFEKATVNQDVGDKALEIYNKYWNLLSVE